MFDNVADGRDVLRFVFVDIDFETFFEGDHQFGDVEGVGAQIVGDIAFAGDRVLLATKLFGDDFDDFRFNLFFVH